MGKKLENKKKHVCVCVCVCIYMYVCMYVCIYTCSCSVVSDSLQHHGLYSPPGSSVHGNSPGNNTEVGYHPLLQGIFPTQGSNPGYYRQILYYLSHQRNPYTHTHTHRCVYICLYMNHLAVHLKLMLINYTPI